MAGKSSLSVCSNSFLTKVFFSQHHYNLSLQTLAQDVDKKIENIGTS